MVTMMAGSAKKKSLLDIVDNLDQFKARIKAHEEAAEARNKAAGEFNRQKIAAQKATEELKAKQNAHDDWERDLNQRALRNQGWEKELFQKRDELIVVQKRHEAEKEEFEKSRLGALAAIREQSDQLARKKSDLDRQQAELTKKLGEIETKHYELLSREASVTRRESFLIGIIAQLKP